MFTIVLKLNNKKASVQLPGTSRTAHSANASLIIQALGRNSAGGWCVSARYFSIADQTLETGALGLVIDGLTFSVGSTGCG